MRRPILTKYSCACVRAIACFTLSLAFMFVFAGPGKAQSPEKIVLTSDRSQPVAAPTKAINPAKSPASNKSAQTTESASQNAASSSLLDECVLNDLLVLDTVRIVFVEVFNFPPNSAVPVTVTQTDAGVVGYALTQAGP